MYKTDDWDDAVEVVLDVREQHPDLWDAWVFAGSLGAVDEDDILAPSLSDDEIAAENAEWERTMDQYEAAETEEIGDDESIDIPGELDTQRPEAEQDTPGMAEPEAVKAQNLEPKEGYFYLYFNTINKKTMKEVKGRVRIIDARRHKEMDLAESHEIVEVRDPNNGNQSVIATHQIFGFKPVERTLSLYNPLTDSTQTFVETIGDSIVLDFELERFEKGDILVMYNVYFYKDAAVMKPESKYELMSLLDMLQENENLEVRIHGHTNGNAAGKIIHLDDEENFFSLRADQEEDKGSAKKLSLYRAETIQKWLIAQGISEDRMSIKGWGGKKMIYDKHDTQAHKNVRVEIEIVED
jgi:outer membrane protein OmpA-like peptidoglycan-associated protein